MTAAVVTANPRTCFRAADGRGFRLDPAQHLTIEMFGGRGDGATDNLPAMQAAMGFTQNSGADWTPRVHFGVGTYRVSAVFDVVRQVHFRGLCDGRYDGSHSDYVPTRLLWPANCKCIRVQSSNTYQDSDWSTGPGGAVYRGSGGSSVFEGLSIEQGAGGADRDKHGIQLRAKATVRNCAFRNIAGNAVHIVATAGAGGALEGNANEWRVDYCTVNSCVGDALHIDGNDVNAGLSTQLTTAFGVSGCGIYDASSLGCTHIAPQITGYGNQGVHYGGRTYQLIQPGAGATVPGTNDMVWYDLGAAATPSATFPAWASGAHYLKLPIAIYGPSYVFGGYEEHGSLLGHCSGGAVMGSTFSLTRYSQALRALGSSQEGLVAANGIGYRKVATAGSTPHAAMGDYQQLMLGAPDPNSQSGNRPTVMRLDSAKDQTPFLWHYEGGDQLLRFFNEKPFLRMTGPLTAQTFGRSTPQPNVTVLYDYALANYADGNAARIHSIGSAAPTSGHHKAGEFRWNSDPTAAGTLGWVCTASGTPGTWTPVAVTSSGFNGSYTADASFGTINVGQSVDGKKVCFRNSLNGMQVWAGLDNASDTFTLASDNGSGGRGAASFYFNYLLFMTPGGGEVARFNDAGLTTKALSASGGIKSSHSSDGIGYSAGAGGTVTQATSKSTGVTLNKASGQVVMNGAALAAGGVVSFTLSNSAIAASDVVVANIAGGASANAYALNVTSVAGGSCRVQLHNIGATSLSEAVAINFAVLKAVAA